jgi:hypothetical protein
MHPDGDNDKPDGRWAQKPDEHGKQGGLACSVRPEQSGR